MSFDCQIFVVADELFADLFCATEGQFALSYPKQVREGFAAPGLHRAETNVVLKRCKPRFARLCYQQLANAIWRRSAARAKT
jgi:hypothetical protein